MEFVVLTEASMNMIVFWVIVPYSLVEVYWCFIGTFCLHHQYSGVGDSRYF
jgi:hypothetical protein